MKRMLFCEISCTLLKESKAKVMYGDQFIDKELLRR